MTATAGSVRMHFETLGAFMATSQSALAKGPIALIFAEDDVELDTTIRHHRVAGFSTVVVFAPAQFAISADLTPLIWRIDYDPTGDNAVQNAVNAINDRTPAGTWLYYCYNAEYLFHPFCETRTVGEMLTFHAEERRDAMLCYVVDLYAGDLDAQNNAVSIDDAWLDKSGYYALARQDPHHHNHPKERQLDFYGGLRWRYEEHIPVTRRKIDRIALFRTKPGLRLLQGHVFNDEEYNTYACAWHHNLTAAICSFRTAKALKRNPGSTYEITSFRWHNSAPFDWHSRQLLDLGLIEPGQWF